MPPDNSSIHRRVVECLRNANKTIWIRASDGCLVRGRERWLDLVLQIRMSRPDLGSAASYSIGSPRSASAFRRISAIPGNSFFALAMYRPLVAIISGVQPS